MKTVVGVMGSSEPTELELRLANEVGVVIARKGFVTLTGGMGGVMAEASKGAKAAGGDVLAIAPVFEKESVNAYVDIAVMTGMRSGRNFMNILSSDVVIAIGSLSAGTLSEIAFAIQQNKPLFIINASEAMKTYLSEFKAPNLHFVDTIDEIESEINLV